MPHMPRNVRNFWIELDIDGKKQRIATGPVRKDGGFNLTVKMRDHGGITQILSIQGLAADSGLLTARVHSHVPDTRDVVSAPKQPTYDFQDGTLTVVGLR